METNDLFCEVSKALAQAELAQTSEEYDLQNASFKAHCVSYILGKEFGADVNDSDFVGWISIDGTRIDYPVMQTIDNPNYYLKHSFE